VRYFVLRPEVPGGVGKKTMMDRSVHPPLVSRLHYELDDWLGDDLLAGFPCYIVTSRLANALRSSGLSGADLAEVTVTTSEEFRELNPDRPLPTFAWLKVIGKAGQDDFGTEYRGRIVVSETALRLLRSFNLKHCEVKTFRLPSP
jgi:hypothetical protein